MLFSDSEDNEISKMDTGLSGETSVSTKPVVNELDEFLLGNDNKDDLRAIFSKQFTLSENVIRQTS